MGFILQVLLLASERLDNSTSEHMFSLYLGALAALREHPRVGPEVPIIVAFEGNSNDASHVALHALSYAPVHVLAECAGNRCGVPKQERESNGIVIAAIAALSSGRVDIAGDAIALATGRNGTRRKTLPDLVLQLRKQLAAYRRDDKGRFSGKAAGPDDLAIAFMMTLYWTAMFCRSEQPEHRLFKDQFDRDIWTANSPLALALSSFGTVPAQAANQQQQQQQQSSSSSSSSSQPTVARRENCYQQLYDRCRACLQPTNGARAQACAVR